MKEYSLKKNDNISFYESISSNFVLKQLGKNQKIKKYSSNFKNFIIIPISFILIFAIFSVSLIGCSKNTNDGYIDLTKHSSVTFDFVDDKTAYSISKNLSLFCSKMPDTIKIPETYENLPVITIHSFSEEHSIKKVIGSKNLQTIESHAFQCTCLSDGINRMQLEEVIFPIDGDLQSIGYWGFFSCVNLKKVVLPEKFSSFGLGVFYDCRNLESLVLHSIIPPSGATILFRCIDSDKPQYRSGGGNMTVYVPDISIEKYKSSEWSRYTIKPISQLYGYEKIESD